MRTQALNKFIECLYLVCKFPWVRMLGNLDTILFIFTAVKEKFKFSEFRQLDLLKDVPVWDM